MTKLYEKRFTELEAQILIVESTKQKNKVSLEKNIITLIVAHY